MTLHKKICATRKLRKELQVAEQQMSDLATNESASKLLRVASKIMRLEEYACSIPTVFIDEEATLLLCASSTGYSSIHLVNLQDRRKLGF